MKALALTFLSLALSGCSLYGLSDRVDQLAAAAR